MNPPPPRPPRGSPGAPGPTPGTRAASPPATPPTRGEEVPRRYLEVIAGPNRKPFQNGSGRLEMAQAIASKDNPPPARVMGNRIWLGHFGQGLVKTPSDFGLRAERPSHPELLDYLAAQFVERG